MRRRYVCDYCLLSAIFVAADVIAVEEGENRPRLIVGSDVVAVVVAFVIVVVAADVIVVVLVLVVAVSSLLM